MAALHREKYNSPVRKLSQKTQLLRPTTPLWSGTIQQSGELLLRKHRDSQFLCLAQLTAGVFPCHQIGGLFADGAADLAAPASMVCLASCRVNRESAPVSTKVIPWNRSSVGVSVLSIQTPASFRR